MRCGVRTEDLETKGSGEAAIKDGMVCGVWEKAPGEAGGWRSLDGRCGRAHHQGESCQKPRRLIKSVGGKEHGHTVLSPADGRKCLEKSPLKQCLKNTCSATEDARSEQG